MSSHNEIKNLCVYHCGRILYREDFVQEDFVLGGKCPGRILCVSWPGGFCTWEDFVPGGKRAAFMWTNNFYKSFSRNILLSAFGCRIFVHYIRMSYPGRFILIESVSVRNFIFGYIIRQLIKLITS